ncbi:MAG: PSD1 and planctomycete cytochrome C domain-containing protein [Pirellulales bacterium]
MSPWIRFRHRATGWLVGLCAGFLAVGAAAAEEATDYLQNVKPLLAKRCYACHGALQQKGGLRLDTAAALRVGGESGSPIASDSPDASLLLKVVTGEAGFRMPPANEGAPLTAAEVDLIRKWLQAGAPAPPNEAPQTPPAEHWSYRAPQNATPPIAADDRWSRGPVDAFLLHAQRQAGVQPRPVASRATLLRRVTLDLTGLPPAADELAEFLSDEEPDALERVVDRLLARPSHGERWGRHWMDVWRYSDWYGSRGGNEIRYSQRHIWRWRDWIVDSLNHDASYLQMLQWMVAGDELAPTDPGALAATGYLGRNWYKFDRNVWMFDAVEQTAQAFLGVTLRCARCHDHKYDPITQEDYYRFRAIFEPHDVRTDPLRGDTPHDKDATLGPYPREGVSRVYDKQLDAPTYVFQRGDSRYPDEARRVSPGAFEVFRAGALAVAEVDLPPAAYYPALRPEFSSTMVAAAETQVAAARRELDKKQQAAAQADAVARQAEAAAKSPTPSPAPPLYRTSFAASDAAAWKPISGQWAWERDRLVQTQVGHFATLLLQQPTLPNQFRVRLRYKPLAAGAYRSIGFSYDYLDQGNSQDVYTSTGDAQQTLQAFHRVNGQQVYPQAGIVPVKLQVGVEATIEAEVRGAQVILSLNGEQKLQYPLPTPRREGKLALWVHSGAAEFLELEIAPLAASLDDLQREARTAQHAVVRQTLQVATAQAELASLQARLVAERIQYGLDSGDAAAAAQTASRASAVAHLAKLAEDRCEAEFACEEARRLNAAGPLAEAEKKRATVAAEIASAEARRDQPDGKYEPLGALHSRRSTGRRAALARWLATPRHPRTSRIAVNQLWLRHFGQALVPSVANFGLQGEAPSHPELLDWLAVRLEDAAWQMKPLHRDLLLSAAYRQSSDEGADSEDARRIDPQNRLLWRMNVRRMEAEVVRDSVLASAGLLDARSGGPELAESEGQTVWRRSLYFRLTPNEKMKFLETFDAADPNACFRRRESVVPQQALVLMNSSLAFDASRSLAAELSAQAPSREEAGQSQFIDAAFRHVLHRTPTAAESAACLAFLTEQATASTAGETTFSAAPGPAPKRPPATDARQRAREDLVHVLYNHNDFVTIR